MNDGGGIVFGKKAPEPSPFYGRGWETRGLADSQGGYEVIDLEMTGRYPQTGLISRNQTPDSLTISSLVLPPMNGARPHTQCPMSHSHRRPRWEGKIPDGNSRQWHILTREYGGAA